MFTRFRINTNNFFKKNKHKIVIVIIIWVIVIVINYILANREKLLLPQISYNPQSPVITTDKVPSKLQQPIVDLIDDFFDACNNKEYEKAYDMLSEECRINMYPDIQRFIIYVDNVFDTKKIYNIQNYSNSKENKTYIYSVRILDDIMATGMTGKDNSLLYYEEKYTIKETNNGIVLSIGQYVSNEKTDNIYEDKHIKISILEKSVKYENEIYKVKITNRTNHTIVLADLTEENEICLNLEDTDIRNIVIKNSKLIILDPKQVETFEIEFNKYYDESKKSTGLIFNAVRVLQSYSGLEENRQKELDEAIDKYSFEMKF